jgi:hypothetical protein
MVTSVYTNSENAIASADPRTKCNISKKLGDSCIYGKEIPAFESRRTNRDLNAFAAGRKAGSDSQRTGAVSFDDCSGDAPEWVEAAPKRYKVSLRWRL